MIMTKKTLKHIKGSTIIELLISLMVVGLIAVAVAVSATQSIKNTGEARFRQVATTLAQEVIEKSRTEQSRLGFYNFRDIVKSLTYCFIDIPDDFETSLPSPGGCTNTDLKVVAGGSFLREVSYHNDAADPDTIEITVTVTWDDSGNERSVELVQKLVRAKQGY